MAGVHDNTKLDITCPKCKGAFKKTIQELKNPCVQCPKCAAAFGSADFKKDLDKVERGLKFFSKKLGNIKL